MFTSLLFQKKRKKEQNFWKFKKKDRAFKEYPWLPLDN